MTIKIYNTVLKMVFFSFDKHTNASYYCGSNQTSHYENISQTVHDNKNNSKSATYGNTHLSGMTRLFQKT